MNNNQYLVHRRNRIKQRLRIRLGVLQMIHKPLLNLLLLPIVVGTVFIWIKKDIVIKFFNISQLLFLIYKYIIIILAILLPLLFIFALIEAIGNATAKQDEADLQEAFERQELRNGHPILMDKKRVNGSNVTMREFYSNIPMKTWVEKQENIADAMNVHFVESLRYGGKSNGKRIVIHTAPGREMTTRGNLYDDEI